MIMADGVPCSFPDMFLGIELGTTGRKMQGLNGGIGREKVPDGLAFVPARSIPEDQNSSVGVTGLDVPEKIHRALTGLVRDRQRHFMPIEHIQSAIEMDIIALRGNADGRGLASVGPDPRRRCLKIQAHLVEGHNHAVGVVLPKIGHFFSNSCSNSAR